MTEDERDELIDLYVDDALPGVAAGAGGGLFSRAPG